MKILFVASGNSAAGISPIVKSQGESLVKAGLDVRYYPISGKGIKGYFKKILDLRKHLSLNKYDIIHAHYGLSAFVALLARRNEKLVVSFMGDDLIGSNRPDGSLTLNSRLFILINIFLAKHFYDFSIVKSEEMNNILSFSHKALIPNGVDLSKFYWISKEKARTSLSIDLSEKLAVFISDPKRAEKNYKLAEKAIYLLSELKIKLLSVSDVDHSGLINYYNAADVLLLTSYHEGSPNVIKEAMACNCPIVSTDVGDVRWIVGDTDGCYISSFDPVDIVCKIKLAIVFCENYGHTNGRDRITKLGLDSETTAFKINAIYKDLICNQET